MSVQPFGEFRAWMRRASTAEKAQAAVAAGAALAVSVWVLTPVGIPSSGTGFEFVEGSATSSAPAAGASSSSAPQSLVPQQGIGGSASSVGVPQTAGGVAAGPAASTSSGSAGGAGAPSRQAAATPPSCGPSSAPGVTSSTIRIAVTLAEIVGPAGNATFGLPTVAEQKQKYNTVIASVNASGGVACRRLAPVYYSVNPADESDMHAKCLDISSANVFAVIDDGGEYAGADCFGQRQIPFLGENLLFAKTASAYYPYLMSAYNLYDNAYHTAILGLRQRGFFDPSRGFHKLGFMYFSCHPELISEMTGWFHQAGLSDSDIVGYDAGCPSPPLARPSDIQQAILKFKSSGVSHVTFAYFPGSIGSFTKAAQQQGFHPKYGLADDGYIGVSYGTSKPDRTNFDGAVTITTSRYGEENVPGYNPSPGTATCDRIFTKAGMPPIYRQSVPSNGGWVCNLVWMLRAAADHASALSRNALPAGLTAARSIPFSYPGGPNDFAATHGVTGADAWRVAEYAARCSCWKLADAQFH
jgi:hypothetical protein